MADTKKKATTKKSSATTKARPKKKRKLTDVNGCAHIHSTVNNTIITMTDINGNCIA